jgi:hypothetical protein
MKTNDDLARWGEPPANPAEEALANQLGEALERQREGSPAPPSGSTEADSLLSASTYLDQFVASVLERSGVLEAASLQGPQDVARYNQSLALQLAKAGTPRLRLLLQQRPAPASARLRTGDRVRVDAVCDRDGYLMVCNIGAAGALHLLCPGSPTDPPAPVKVGRPVCVLYAQLVPPAGHEVVLAVWSRQPLPLRDLLGPSTASLGPGRAHATTEDLEQLSVFLHNLPEDDWSAVVLEVDHEP